MVEREGEGLDPTSSFLFRMGYITHRNYAGEVGWPRLKDTFLLYFLSARREIGAPIIHTRVLCHFPFTSFFGFFISTPCSLLSHCLVGLSHTRFSFSPFSL